MILWWVIVSPFVASVLAAVLSTRSRNAQALLTGAVALSNTLVLAVLFPAIADGGVVSARWSWLPSLGVDIVLRVDGLAWLFGMLVSAIGALVVLYARYYLSADDPAARFYSLLSAFMGAMLGVVLSGNLVQLVVFWELTSVLSFLLIGYWHHRKDARRGARMALVVTATGGLCLLGGVVLIGQIVGTFDLEHVLASGDRLRAHPLYTPALVLVLLGALTKSAQFPFHFWLPHAMAAPTPVSAYLHSATMVKAGVFLLARLWPALSGSDEWFWIVSGTGLATLLLGAFAAMFQNDLKSLLAYSTISHLGLITLLLGMNSPLAAVAAVFHMMNHATFKASLFMAVGIIDHETGTRDMRVLDGLYPHMPGTAKLAMVACAAMAGVPLLNGFLSKEMFFAETVYLQSSAWIEYGLPLAATLAGVFAVVYSLRFGHDVFFGDSPKNCPRMPHEPVRWMRIPIELLVVACLVVGIVPDWSIGPILAAASRPVVGGQLPEYSLAIWHGFNAPLVMSLVALAGGMGVYGVFAARFKRRALRSTPFLDKLDGKRLFNRTLALANRGARAALMHASSRRLQLQMLCMLVVAGAAALGSALVVPLDWGDRPRVAGSTEFALLWLVAGAAAIGAAWHAKFRRLMALALLGVVGIAVCLTFAWFSAPDLALTQLSVEAVTMVLILLGLRWLPKRVPGQEVDETRRARWRRARDLLIAALAGTGLATLSYAMLTRTGYQSISPFFIENALPGGGGTNVVNVMLVDFRAFDTLGEITVLATVALTIYALLRRFRPPREVAVLPPQQQALLVDRSTDLWQPQLSADEADPAQGYLLVPSVLVRLLLPFAMVVSLHLFLRGHNQPGGGFVAGLVLATAFIAQYIVSGTEWVEDRMDLNPPWWIAAGLLLVVGTGLGALTFGFPFLTTHTAHVTLPWLGELHLPTAALFDAGVFAVVVGSTLLMLTALAHQSLRARRQERR